MAIPTRNDWHYDDALANMTSHWVDPETRELRPNASAILKAIMAEVQSLEDMAYSLTFDRLLSSAYGAGLDQVGALVGQDRPSDDDDEFRAYISARIAINRSGGEPDRVLYVTLTVTGADECRLDQIHPAGLQIQYWVTTALSEERRDRVAQMVLETIAAGVSIDLVEATTGIAFGFVGAPGALGFNDGVFAESVYVGG